MQDIYISGGAMTPFGRHPGVLAPELAQQAILAAMDDAGVSPHDIQAIYCANVLGGMILGQLIVRDLGFDGIPVYNVENACASGATGVHLARHARAAVGDVIPPDQRDGCCDAAIRSSGLWSGSTTAQASCERNVSCAMPEGAWLRASTPKPGQTIPGGAGGAGGAPIPPAISRRTPPGPS